MAAVEHAAEHAAGPDQDCAEKPPELQYGHGVGFRRTSTASVSDETTRYARSTAGAAAATATMVKAVDGRPYAALARALLKARTAAEREKILARHSHARTA
jgi:hypothetical protein